MTTTKPVSFRSDDACWQAVLHRDAGAAGVFYYSVRTTGVYCRPGCPARTPRRENVRFHPTQEDARKAGFRPCRRCRPEDTALADRQRELVIAACRQIESAENPPSLEELALEAGLSVSHFHRLFKAHTGVTPRSYASAHRTDRVRQELTERDTVTEAIYGAGYNSNGRFYASTNGILGMTPSAFRDGGAGTTIRFAVGESSLGSVLVGATEKGICAILLGDDPDELAREFQRRFGKAELIGTDPEFERVVGEVVALVDDPTVGHQLPLDIRGTAFQRRVWEALSAIPAGTTVTYSEIARRIGQPRAVRAVAGACAANHLAVLIPCHRVVRTDGTLSGYRWGVERKAELLRKEGQVVRGASEGSSNDEPRVEDTRGSEFTRQ
jgi:AraC family transcriptional regulator, regulatory protein of adaptative response / methylated-DNA-[protein]-cysteine methyltransferase